MNGIAIIVPGADYSHEGLGRVTLLEDTVLESLSITGVSEITGRVVQMVVAYVPALTSDRDVVWSITSGGQYASINSSTGELTILSGANSSAVTVHVESTNDSSIYAEKQLTLTYQESLLELEISGESVVSGKTASYSLAYLYDGVETSDQQYKGCTWEVVSGPATIKSQDADGCVLQLDSTADNSTIVLRASSTVEQGVQATKTITATYVGNNIVWTTGIKFVQGDGTWKTQGSGGHYVERDVVAGNTYTLCYDGNPFPINQLNFLDSNGDHVTTVVQNILTTSFTVPAGATKAVISIYDMQYAYNVSNLYDWSLFTLEDGALYSNAATGYDVNSMLLGFVRDTGQLQYSATWRTVCITLRRGKTVTCTGSFYVARKDGGNLSPASTPGWQDNYVLTASVDGTQIFVSKQNIETEDFVTYLSTNITLS